MKQTKFERVRPPFKATAERDRLIERLLKMTIADVLSYDEITKIIGERAQSTRGYNIMNSAKKVLRTESHRVFVNIPNNGLKRLDDEDIVQHVTTHIVSVRRKVKVGTQELECVSYVELPTEQKTNYHLNRTLLHYVTAMINNESIKNTRALIAAQPEVVNAGNVLSLFQVAQPTKKAG